MATFKKLSISGSGGGGAPAIIDVEKLPELTENFDKNSFYRIPGETEFTACAIMQGQTIPVTVVDSEADLPDPSTAAEGSAYYLIAGFDYTDEYTDQHWVMLVTSEDEPNMWGPAIPALTTAGLTINEITDPSQASSEQTVVNLCLQETKFEPKVYYFMDGEFKLVGGAKIVAPGGWTGTTVPNSGILENLYININLTPEEVNNIISEANLTWISGGDVGTIYAIGLAETIGCLAIMNMSDAGVSGYVIMEMMTSTIVFNGIDISTLPPEIAGDASAALGAPGWNTAIIPGGVFPVNSELFSSLPDEGIESIGAENDKLAMIFSTTPFEMLPGETVATLDGDYNGETITHNYNTIDIKALLDEKKLPLKIKLKDIGTLVPNSGYVGNVYFNTNLSTEEVVAIMSEVAPIQEDGSSGMYVLIANESANKAIMCSRAGTGTEDDPIKIVIMAITSDGFQSIFSNDTDNPGWTPDFIESTNGAVPINDIAVAYTSGLSVGTANNKLLKLFSITPFDILKLQNKTVELTTAYQSITADEGYDALRTVNVPGIALQSKSATANGTVTPDSGYDGLQSVIVNVQPALQEKEVTINGEIIPDEGYNGLSKVNVNVDPVIETFTVQDTSEVSASAYRKLPIKNIVLRSTSDLPLTTIGGYAFAYNKKLAAINIPSSVTSIGERAFYGCESLKSINVPEANNNYKSIDGVLYNKDGTELIYCPLAIEKSTLDIPEGVTIFKEIEGPGSSTIESIVAPSTLTKYAYENYMSTRVYAYGTPYKNFYYSGTIEDWCNNLNTKGMFGSFATMLPWVCADNFYIDGELVTEELTIPQGVTKIPDHAFQRSFSEGPADGSVVTSPLKIINIPSTVTSIGISAFQQGLDYSRMDDSQTVTNYDGTVEQWFSITRASTEFRDGPYGTIYCSDGVLRNGMVYTLSNNGDHYTVTQGYAHHLYNNSLRILNEIDGIPVTEIADNASISTCPRYLTIPDNITTIGASAFKGATSLNTIYISSSLTSIGSEAFSGCEYLANIRYSGTIAEWEAIDKGENWDKNIDIKYTITCSDGTIENQPPVYTSLDDVSWTEIAQAFKTNAVPDTWEIGSTKHVTLTNGETFTVRLCDTQADRYAYTDGSGGNKAVFEFVELQTATRYMNPTNTNTGGWASCYMRHTVMQEIFDMLPVDLQEVISEVNVLSGVGGVNTTDTSTSANKLFLPSVSEVFNSETHSNYLNESPLGQYTYYAENDTLSMRRKYQLGSSSKRIWWLRSPFRTDNSQHTPSFAYTGSGLTTGWYESSSTVPGVAPVFAI